MIGFGGALTWYSDRVLVNSKSEEIYQLMFEDLGMNILRLKNWYYPQDYPVNKSPEVMLTSGDKTMFEATNLFYAKAKENNLKIYKIRQALLVPRFPYIYQADALDTKLEMVRAGRSG